MTRRCVACRASPTPSERLLREVTRGLRTGRLSAIPCYETVPQASLPREFVTSRTVDGLEVLLLVRERHNVRTETVLAVRGGEP